MVPSKWLIHFPPRSVQKELSGERQQTAPLRLFCFPYAGGGASIYRLWGQALHPLADVYAVQLPGREERIAHPRCYSIQRLVQAMLDEGLDWFDKPYALFGHSMGAKIVFELAMRLCEAGRPPAQVFVSASRPPCLPEKRQIHTMPDDLFIDELRHLAGTPEAILRDKAFMDMLLPLLRADFTMDETYQNSAVLDVPAAVLGGTQDAEASRCVLEAWDRCFTSPISLHMIPGGHFFIREQADALLDVVAARLRMMQQ